MKKYLLLIFGILIHLSLFNYVSADYFFDPVNGNNANDCRSESTPCKSSHKFFSVLPVVRPGEAIQFKSGTIMPLQSDIRINVSGTEEQPIVIQTYGGNTKAILDGSLVHSGVLSLNIYLQQWIIIRDLEFRNGKGAIGVWGSENIMIDNIRITNRCKQECIHIKYRNGRPSKFVTIQNSIIEPVQRTEGIYVGTDPSADGGNIDTTSDVLIQNSIIKNGTHGECIEMKDGTSRVVIRGNIFLNNRVMPGANGCVFSSRRRPESPPGNHIVESNVFLNTTGLNGYPIRVRNESQIRFNIIDKSERDGIYAEQPSTHPLYERLIEYNTIVRSQERGIMAWGELTQARNNIKWLNKTGNDIHDPLLLDIDNGDYRLAFGSSAVGSGAFPTPFIEGEN